MDNGTFLREHLCYDDPALVGVKEAVDKQDLSAAMSAFAAHVRAWFAKQPPLRQHEIGELQGIYRQEDETDRMIADRVLRGDFMCCGIPYHVDGEIDWEHNPTPDGYREFPWQLNRHIEFIALANTYRETGDEIYAQRYRELILSWINACPVPENMPGGATVCWRTIETGLRSTNWCEAFSTFVQSPSLSDEDVVAIVASFWENGWRLRHFNTCGNWLFMEMNGLIHIALLFPFFKEAAEWETYLSDRLEKAISQQLYPEGFQYELTPGYHWVVAHHSIRILEMYVYRGLPCPPVLKERIRRMVDIYLRLGDPFGYAPEMNDKEPPHLREVMQLALPLFSEDPEVCWGAGEGGHPPSYLSTAMPYAGVAVSRTGWDKNALWCFFEDAPFGFGHQHEDKLQIQMAAYGRRFLIEAGSNAYDASPMHNYGLSSFGHNVVLVDGLGQNRRARYNNRNLRTDVLSGLYWRSEETFDAAQGEYDEGFGPEFASVRHQRRVLVLKELPLPAVVVIDRLYPEDGAAHTYEALWHMADMPVSMLDDVAVAGEAGTPRLCVAAAGVDERRLVRGQTEPYVQGFRCHMVTAKCAPIPTLIQARQSDGPVRLVTVFVPLPAEADVPKVELAASDRVENTGCSLMIGAQMLQLDEKDYFSE